MCPGQSLSELVRCLGARNFVAEGTRNWWNCAGRIGQKDNCLAAGEACWELLELVRAAYVWEAGWASGMNNYIYIHSYQNGQCLMPDKQLFITSTSICLAQYDGCFFHIGVTNLCLWRRLQQFPASGDRMDILAVDGNCKLHHRTCSLPFAKLLPSPHVNTSAAPCSHRPPASGPTSGHN